MRDIIETERLVLRPLALTDAPAFSKYAGDYDIAKMTGSIPHPFPVISAEAKLLMLMGKKRCGRALPYTITLDGGDMIGIADLFRRSDDHDWELGYWVARPYWGRGYIPEAMNALMNEAERTMGVTTFIAGVWHDNPGSIRVLEKLGFRSLGLDGKHFAMARLENTLSLGFVRKGTERLQVAGKTAIHAS